MNREERAKQFMPFDALKGLQTALRLKEYEHERMQKVDIQEEKAHKISNILLNLNSGDILKAEYFVDGYIQSTTGSAKLDIENGCLKIDSKKINIVDIVDIDRS